ncbi:hypothetical protein CRG98_008175 [Punica granatum]|uniref:Retrotransposon gag domain-containing protein n=1 Tax=Punica granatum TaxID=22663 RepID=A0A2I0KSI6_PUNGR|nr:hypothetical protein CRG98_008175 [Punica granatum]
MEETILALQASDARPDARYGDCSLFPGMWLPSKFKIPEFKTYEGTTDPRHHLHHYRGKMLHYWGYEEFVIHSFQDSLSGSALDWFMSLKAEDIPTWADLSRKFIDQYQYCAKAPPTLLELSTKEMARGQSPTSPVASDLTIVRPLCTRIGSAPSIQAPGVENFSTGATEPYFAGSAGRRHTKPTPQAVHTSAAPLSHIYRQLLAGDQIRPISPGPNFDPSVQDQSKRYEYHQGAPGHTLNNCWRLRDEIQKRIDSNKLTFNAVRPPNVQDNPLPDHRPSSGPSINMISICASGRDEDAQDNPLPFVIDYTPEEPTVGFMGRMASPAPFVVDIPAREPHADSKVPWTYEGSVGSVEQQFSVMARDKRKAPATEVVAAPESSPFPSKRVTEEKAEAFMKIIKASEYKVVEQMAKSSAHISLLALLLGSEPHREALLRVLTAAQVPKETPCDRIEETVGSIFSNSISFSDDELPSEGWAHWRALHIICKCNNYIIGRVMIDNGSALNVCPVTTLMMQIVARLQRIQFKFQLDRLREHEQRSLKMNSMA